MDLVLRHDRDRALRRDLCGATGQPRARSSVGSGRAASRTRSSPLRLWVIADACISRFPFGGFSWGELGYAFHDIAPARAVAGVGGLTFITFLAVALNALIADLFGARRNKRRYVQAYVGITLIAAAVVVSTVTRPEPRVAGFLRVALIQGTTRTAT